MSENEGTKARRLSIASLARRIAGWLIMLAIGVWGALALYFRGPGSNGLHLVLAGAYVAAMIALYILLRTPLHRLLGIAGLFALILAWWTTIRPSNDRDWMPDVAVLPYATIDGNRIAVHNIRNCDYRSENDYAVRYYDATFDLAQLQSVDLFLCYWGARPIAHTMLSFGFSDGRHLCISIETRKEKNEQYSALRGFFKQYELTYVVADEHDLVRLRTNYRREDVYLYRLNAQPPLARAVLLDYLKCINQFRERPEWYNALTSNCTTNIRGHTKPYAQRSRWDWRLLANGYLDEMMYERGVVDRRLNFAELRERSRINERALKAGDAADFSQQIREGLPTPE